MKSRLLVSVVGIPLLLFVVLAGHTLLLVAALMVLAGIAAAELQNCVSGTKRSLLSGLSAVFSAAAVGWYYMWPETVYVWFVVQTILLSTYVVCKAGDVKFDQFTASLFSGMMLPYAFAAFIRMDAAGYHRAFLLLPLILSFASDTGGYFIGITFGKHKLAPKVSPKKTVEGSVGGLAFNVIGGIVFVLVMKQLGVELSMWLMVCLSALCSVIAQIGDLSFSVIKRQYGIKDYGHLFLEHGGVLDRFDSVLFVAPVIEIALKLWGKL